MSSTILNVIGLIAVTVGGIGAAYCTPPPPRYNDDGSVSLSATPDKSKRIEISRRQKWVKPLLGLIGDGTLMQLVAICLSK